MKFPHKVIYQHNGVADYPIKFFQEGLIDHFIQTKKNGGLGLGTRDLFAASFSPISILLQNDQYLGGDITELMAHHAASYIGQIDPVSGKKIASVSLAGVIGAPGRYSERCHMISTAFYRQMEAGGILGHFGAGPHHDGPWRESQIQALYEKENLTHFTPPFAPWVIDNGRTAERENPDGSRWKHFPDTKQAFLVSGPVKEKHVYPAFSDAEWDLVLATQTWPDGQIPENERANSFHVWN